MNRSVAVYVAEEHALAARVAARRRALGLALGFKLKAWEAPVWERMRLDWFLTSPGNGSRMFHNEDPGWGPVRPGGPKLYVIPDIGIMSYMDALAAAEKAVRDDA